MVQAENKWERITLEGEADRLYTKPRTFAQDVWFRFRHKPTALLGLIITGIILGPAALNLLDPKILSISSCLTGIGFAPPPEDPINPVTPGVFRTTYHASSVMIISTNR